MSGSATTFGKDNPLSVIRGSTVTPPANWHLCLLTANPGIAGSTASEVSTSGTGYSRKLIPANTTNWSAPALAASNGRFIENLLAQTIGTVTATWGTFTHWGLMDAASGGNMWYYGDLNGGTGFTPTVGTTVVIDIGAIDITFAEALNGSKYF